MITRARIDRLSATLGFRPDVLEKVLRLVGILRRLDTHELSAGTWVLKGGTALNLLHLDAPRLSIDIDLDFVGVESVDDLPDARELFERILVSCCEREKCAVRRAPPEHAGGKFRLRFPSVFGGTQNLEVDVNYVARVPLLGVERRRIVLDLQEEQVTVPTLALQELAAGKFAALASRSAPRDYFDAAGILTAAPELLDDPGFRAALVCRAASSREDGRRWALTTSGLSVRDVAQQLVPMLRVEISGATTDARELTERLRSALGAVASRLFSWSVSELQFLDALLDRGELDSSPLTSDPQMQDRILRQPMLRWKRLHVLKHLETDS